jgi:hypothetical protein
MNRKFVNYFEDARDNANENFLSFNGDFTFDDYGMDDFSADGDMGQAIAAPTSQPYIINVQNTNTTSNISNVTILGAYSNISAASPAFGNSTGISISVGIANITYTEFLYQSMNKPFTVGLTYLAGSGTNATSQVLATLTVTQKDVNGNVASKVLTPTVDPYQFQTDKVAFKFNYKVDGFTYLIISTVYAATTAQIYLYPSETVSISRGLSGRRAVQNYGNPRVERGNVLRIQNGRG